MIKITQILIKTMRRTQPYDNFYFIITSMIEQYMYEVHAFENTSRLQQSWWSLLLLLGFLKNSSGET